MLFPYFLGEFEEPECVLAHGGRPEHGGRSKVALRGRPGAHPVGGPQVALFYWARRAGSIGQHVFVIRGRSHIVTRFVGIWTPHARWRRSGRRVVPGAEVAQDLLHHPGVVNDGKDPHRVLADGAAQGVNMPNAEDQVAPFLGRELERWWWRTARPVRNQLRRQAPLADAAHFVAVPAVVADHLRPVSGICWVMAIRKSVAVKTAPQ